jgi:predicted ATPase
VRIAVSGSHGTGKSTLVADLVRRLPDHEAFDEPYHLLEDEGYAFEQPPSSDDFEQLYRRSVSLLLGQRGSNVFFDRSPADYLAYRTALDPASALPDWVTETASALATLDLVVFVPIEHPDRFDTVDAPKLRRRVDHILHEMFVERTWGFDVPVITVHGSLNERAEQVMARLAAL